MLELFLSILFDWGLFFLIGAIVHIAYTEGYNKGIKNNDNE